jgi:hypothetical protein
VGSANGFVNPRCFSVLYAAAPPEAGSKARRRTSIWQRSTNMVSKLSAFLSPFLAAATLATALVAAPTVARADERSHARVDVIAHERDERRWERERWERERREREHRVACERAYAWGAPAWRLREMGCYAR